MYKPRSFPSLSLFLSLLFLSCREQFNICMAHFAHCHDRSGVYIYIYIYIYILSHTHTHTHTHTVFRQMSLLFTPGQISDLSPLSSVIYIYIYKMFKCTLMLAPTHLIITPSLQGFLSPRHARTRARAHTHTHTHCIHFMIQWFARGLRQLMRTTF